MSVNKVHGQRQGGVFADGFFTCRPQLRNRVQSALHLQLTKPDPVSLARTRGWLPLYAARIEDLGPGDFGKVDCAACRHVALLRQKILLKAGLSRSAKVLDLKGSLRCRGCGREERRRMGNTSSPLPLGLARPDRDCQAGSANAESRRPVQSRVALAFNPRYVLASQTQ